MKILICDDAGFVREILGHALFELGYVVAAEARDGVEAVSRALAVQPDVVFLDLVLPLKNGAEAGKEIQDFVPSVKIVILSSLDSPHLAKTAKDLNAFAVLAKPFTKKDLKNVLEKLEGRLGEVQGG